MVPYTDPDSRALERRHRWQQVIPDAQISRLIVVLGILSAAASFGLLVEIIEEIRVGHALGDVDLHVFYWWQHLRSPLLDQWFVVITRLGNVPALLAVGLGCGASLLIARRGFEVLAMLGCIAASGVTALSLKWLLYRNRPIPSVPLVTENNPAFPSIHASLSLVSYVFAAYLIARGMRNARNRILVLGVGLGFALLIGLSRLYLGVHWLSDVLGGYALGGVWLALLVTMTELHRAEQPPPACSHKQQAALRWGLLLGLPALVLFLWLYALGWPVRWFPR